MPDDIFAFVKQEESAYALPIEVIDGWEWSMKEHIRLSKLYKNSQFGQGNDSKQRDDKPFRNIVKPVLNVQYRTEGFDVKDIALYVDNEDEYFKSFLLKKYHDRWAQDKGIDEFIDDVNESKVDYGGALVRDVEGDAPEMVPLETIAFCDQTNMLGGPIGIKHFYAPDELQRFQSRNWGNPAFGATITIEEAIVLAKSGKKPSSNKGETKTPGKYVECYEVHGMLPESWLRKGGSPDKYIRQMHILLYYYDKDGKKQGLTLFAGREQEGIFKVFLRDKIQGRALGCGGVEELFDPQVWANYNEIVMKGMLDAASKVIIKTTDTTMKAKHPTGLKDLDNLSIVDVEEGKDAGVMDTTPRSFALFEKKVNEWEQVGRTIGAANEAVLGESPASGTPFKLQALVTTQGLGLHEYRRGKYASWMGGVYRDWVIPRLSKDIANGKKFLEELSLRELQEIADRIAACQIEDIKKEKILSGQVIVNSDLARVEQEIKARFMKKGSKQFLEVLKGEFSEQPIGVQVSIAGKQKDLDKITDKVVNIIRQIIATPAILDDPRMARLFNEIIELSGLSPIDFSAPMPVKAPAPAAPAAPAQPAAPFIPTPAPAEA